MKFHKTISEIELNNALNIYVNFPERAIESMYIITEYVINNFLGDEEEIHIPAEKIQNKIYTMIKQYCLEQLTNEGFLDVCFGERMPIYSLTKKGINKQKKICENFVKTNIPPCFKDTILIERKQNDKK